LIIIIVVVVLVVRSRNGNALGGDDDDDQRAPNAPAGMPNLSFPEGLDPQKVQTSFLAIQDAWQKKDLRLVRKWMSDGVYQRYTAQFGIMNKLNQVNRLSNIRIYTIDVAKVSTDGKYQSADVAVSFQMDDEFLSDKYPQFNEQYESDRDTEFWTYIKRLDAHSDKNLYNNNNCPNCGAAFEATMGEISRCASCGTLTNNATYDWVLSEITQADDYTGGPAIDNNDELHQLTKNDSLFSLQRMEDIASNVFMQIMEALAGGDNKKLRRFADKDTTAAIIAYKASHGNYIFDRLYLNDVSLKEYNTGNGLLTLAFSLVVSYKRVQIAGERLSLIDSDITTRHYRLALSKNLNALKTAAKETVYSHECPSCGAPYTDTTDDVCTYCGAPVIDLSANWVLTGFEFGG
jgi:predicted lipid-binding transport protein (Tim44 family)